MPHQYQELFENSVLTDIIHMEANGSHLLQNLKINVPYSIISNQGVVDSNEVNFSLTVPGYHYEDSILMDQSMLKQHRHNAFECMIVLSGTVTHHVGNHTFHYSKGHCCLLGRNITHVEEYSKDFEVIFCILQKDLIQQILNHRRIFREDRQKEGSLIMQLVNEEDELQLDKIYIDFFPINDELVVSKLFSLIEDLKEVTIAPEPGSTFMIMGLFSKFLSLLEDKSLFCSTKVQCEASQQDYLFVKIRSIIEAYHGCITRGQLEDILHYNGEYLNRIVKKFTGNNITNLCKSYLLAEFNLRLLNTDQNIELILDELKVSNNAHFYKLYKSHYGMTPHNYRISNGKTRSFIN